MHEILFRAQAINRIEGREYRTNYKNGDWVYGLVTRLYDERFEMLPATMTNTDGVSGIDVDHKTIGQYTGLTDKNGTKIFEGDIVTFGDNIYKIVFENGSFALCDESGGMIWKIGGHNDYCYSLLPLHFDCCWKENYAYDIEVIGNIHDSSELLKEE